MRIPLSLVAFLAMIGLPAFTTAQDKNEQTATGKIVVAKHVFKFQVGDIYEAVAEGTNFVPQLNVNQRELTMTQLQVKFDPNTRYVSRHYLVPKASGDFPIVINYSPFGTDPLQPLEYKIAVKRYSFAKTPLFEKQDKLAASDPVYQERGSPHKAYPITLKSGKFYMIDMVHKQGFGFGGGLDPYLYLEDTKPANANQRVVAHDDDSGGDLNARIIYQATKDGEFRVIATSLNKTPGDFTVTVREQE
jgi:hypothetical protein